jgi:hypothetical protein
MHKPVSLLTSVEIGMKNITIWEGIEMYFGGVLLLELIMKCMVPISWDTIVKKNSGILFGTIM